MIREVAAEKGDSSHFFKKKDGTPLMEGGTPGGNLFHDFSAVEKMQKKNRTVGALETKVAQLEADLADMTKARDTWKNRCSQDSSTWKIQYGIQVLFRVKDEVSRETMLEELSLILSKCPQEDANVQAARKALQAYSAKANSVEAKSMLSSNFEVFNDFKVVEATFAKIVQHVHEKPLDQHKFDWLYHQLLVETARRANLQHADIAGEFQRIKDSVRSTDDTNWHAGAHIVQLVELYEGSLFHPELGECIMDEFEKSIKPLLKWMDKQKPNSEFAAVNQMVERETNKVHHQLQHQRGVIRNLINYAEANEMADFENWGQDKQASEHKKNVSMFFAYLFELWRNEGTICTGGPVQVEFHHFSVGLAKYLPYMWGRNGSVGKYLLQPKLFVRRAVELCKPLAIKRWEDQQKGKPVSDPRADALKAIRDVQNDASWFTKENVERLKHSLSQLPEGSQHKVSLSPDTVKTKGAPAKKKSERRSGN